MGASHQEVDEVSFVQHSKAIVTLAIGERYLRVWKNVCEANWRVYARKYGYDVICLEHPLDHSERARQRSPAWQKCLILGQDFATQYERMVWVDSDILINTALAPCIVENVPVDKVGVVEVYAQPRYKEFLQRAYELWGGQAVVNYTPQEYYQSRGFSQGFPQVVQTGVMVLSPRHHRHLLEETYYKYEDKGGREWHMEMCPLSFELLRAGAVHWIDPRFNMMWGEQEILHYPFLCHPEPRRTFFSRLKHKVATLLEGTTLLSLKRACITAAFLGCYFLHFGGSELSTMELTDVTVRSWRDSRLSPPDDRKASYPWRSGKSQKTLKGVGV